MELDIKQIMDIIPHRQPFLLIDKVTDMEPGKSIKGYKNLSYNEPFFAGHFPNEPVMPGVLQIEALAQLGAVCVLSLDDNKGKTAYFAGIKEAKFKQKVVPGDRLELSCEIIKTKGPVGVGACEAHVNGKLACKAEISFMIG
ncbi:MAG: 3-hydroxyacyl-ACP dehydratase FabZ [Lachnospiraceae bacterium]|nr:3-hydroxyacyl-ACP dehydratase FabZ [Lachnospiraceae bacterium]